MSHRNKLEQKAARKQERAAHVPSLCLSSPNSLRDRLVAALVKKPVDRVAREIGRCSRRVAKALAIMSSLAPDSKFRKPLELDVQINRMAGGLAMIELDKRLSSKPANA